MPRYEYQCFHCGLKFDKYARASQVKPSMSCSGCQEAAQLCVPEGVSFQFNVSHTNAGPVPQNTGVSQLDHVADRIIAQDADAGWEHVKNRQAAKRAVLRANPGAKRHHLATTGDGRYKVSPRDPREDTKRLITHIHNGLNK